MTKEKKPTVKESRIASAAEFVDSRAGAWFGIEQGPEQTEMAEHLKTTYKLTRTEIAELLGLSERQVKTRLASYKMYVAKGLIPTGLIAYKESPKESVTKDEEERLNQSYSRTVGKQALTQMIFEDKLAEAVAKHVPTEKMLEKIKELQSKIVVHKSDNKPEGVIANIGDWHFGLVNEQYNNTIAREVFYRYLDKVLRLTELHRKFVPVPTLYLNLLGDNIQNSFCNFSNQRWSTEMSSIDQTEGLIEDSIKAIEIGLLNFDKVVVNGCIGNHGAIFSKKTTTEVDHANFEMMAFRTLKWAFRSEPRVTVNMTTNWYMIQDIEGVKVMLQHGHQLNAGQGNLDGLVAQFRKLQDVLPKFDVGILAHFHRLARLPLPVPYGTTKLRTLYMNGTSILGDNHSLQHGAGHTQAWWVHFIGSNDPKVTAEYAVNLYD